MRSSSRASKILLAAPAALLLAAASPAQQAGGLMAEKLAAVKQAAAANQQALRQYRWIENIQVAVNGEVRNSKQMSCQYGADGKPGPFRDDGVTRP